MRLFKFSKSSFGDTTVPPPAAPRIIIRLTLFLLLSIIASFVILIRFAPKPPLHDRYTVFDGFDWESLTIADAKKGFVTDSIFGHYPFLIEYSDARREAKLSFYGEGSGPGGIFLVWLRDLIVWAQGIVGVPGSGWTPDSIYTLRRSTLHPEDWDLIASYNSPIDPVPSFFHRVNDPRLNQLSALLADRRIQIEPILQASASLAIAYMAPPFESQSLETLRSLSEAMVRDHPGDPAYRMFLVNALAAAHDEKELSLQIESLRPGIATMPGLKTVFRRAEDSLKAIKLSSERVNLADYLNANFSSTSTLAARVKAMPGMLTQRDFALDVPPLEPRSDRTNSSPFAENAYAMITIALEDMVAGRRREALELLVLIYYASDLIWKSLGSNEAYYVIETQNAALDGLEIYILNACETEGEIQEAWARLAWLEEKKHFPPSEIAIWDHAYLSSYQRTYLTNVRKGVEARFQLLRMAVAARLHVIATGKLPASEADFAALLPTLPDDMFTTGPVPMRFSSNGTTCTLYSVGPDEVDDGGLIDFDVNYRRITKGDIVLRVPLDRRFPFSRGGLRASDAADVKRQFPKGLPNDPFARYDVRELNVSTSGPLMIYTRGAYGVDHQRDPNIEAIKGAADVAYDPTNGSRSRGDIGIIVPGRTP